MLGAIDDAAAIDLGAHRFGHSKLVDALASRLDAGDAHAAHGRRRRSVLARSRASAPARRSATTTSFEANNVARLETAGGDDFEIRYFETNHGEHLLHHNKYLAVSRRRRRAVRPARRRGEPDGARGFNDNFENIYFIKVPKVLEAFDTQFARVWDGKQGDAATSRTRRSPRRAMLMPASDVAPQ